MLNPYSTATKKYLAFIFCKASQSFIILLEHFELLLFVCSFTFAFYEWRVATLQVSYTLYCDIYYGDRGSQHLSTAPATIICYKTTFLKNFKNVNTRTTNTTTPQFVNRKSKVINNSFKCKNLHHLHLSGKLFKFIHEPRE